MERVVWNDDLNIGVEIIDKAHAKLFRIMDKLLDVSEDEKDRQHTSKEGIKYLETYSMKHFSEEEDYMRLIKYNGYAEHKRIHDNFRDKVLVAIKKDLELSNYSSMAIQRFVMTLNNWLTEHIMNADQAIVGKKVQKKNSDFSSQVSIISRAMNRIMPEMFQAEPHLASAEYKGQNIGNAFYCYQHYDTENGIRWQLMIGIGDSLLLRAVNRMSEEAKQLSIEELDTENILPIFQQLFQNTGKIFRAKKEYPVTKDNLMSRDAFRSAFMKTHPHSLQFSTKFGALIFCYRCWKIKIQK